MNMWLAVAVGVFIGCVISLIVFLFLIGTWYLGDLREDRSTEDDKPYYFMEVSKGAAGRMGVNKFVLLKVKRENYVKPE